MTAEKAIYQLLQDNIPALENRIYAMIASQDQDPPFCVFQRTDSSRWRSINNPSGIAQAFIQIDVYARDYYQAKTIAADVEQLLDGYRGTVDFTGDSPADAIKIAGISLQNDIDILEQSDEPILHRNSAAYLVTYYLG
jgi:hypothetical protein